MSRRGYGHYTPSQAAQHRFSAPTNQNKIYKGVTVARVKLNESATPLLESLDLPQGCPV